MTIKKNHKIKQLIFYFLPGLEKIQYEFNPGQQMLPGMMPLPPPPPPLPPQRPKRQNYPTEIPELSQDLKSESHDGWTCEEDEFIAITLLNVPYIEQKSLFGPQVMNFLLLFFKSKS